MLATLNGQIRLPTVLDFLKIHLSKVPNERRLKLMDLDPSDPDWEDPYVPESPDGVFQKLEKDVSYYVYIIQDAAQEAKESKMAEAVQSGARYERRA